MRILLVGKNSIVAKAFVEVYADKYEITGIGREDEIKAAVFDAVIFLAQSKDYKEPKFTADLFKVNIELLFNTINKVQTQKFIYFSTGAVYKKNDTGHYTTASEVDAGSTNPYVASKLMGEMLLQANSEKIRSTIVLRPFFIYGKAQKESMLMKSMYNKIVNGEKISLNNGKGLVFNPVYADDVASLLHHLLQGDLLGYHVFNASGNEVVSLDEVVNKLAQNLNKKPVIEASTNAETIMTGEAAIPGWAPQTNLEQGLYHTFFSEQ